jgi:hypothetical protein
MLIILILQKKSGISNFGFSVLPLPLHTHIMNNLWIIADDGVSNFGLEGVVRRHASIRTVLGGGRGGAREGGKDIKGRKDVERTYICVHVHIRRLTAVY